eukprot:SAG22_NODE_3032_length_2012_cov_0.873497_2_plen_119_part_00
MRDYSKLNASRLRSSPFAHNSASFAAQRYYNELAVQALEKAGHVLARPVRAAITRMVRLGSRLENQLPVRDSVLSLIIEPFRGAQCGTETNTHRPRLFVFVCYRCRPRVPSSSQKQVG